MEYINQSPYFINNLKRFVLYRNLRINRIRTLNASIVTTDISNADIKYAHIKDLDVSNTDISYAYIHDLEAKKADFDNLNVKHDITLNNNPYLPIGIVLPYATTTAPQGWLVCNGQEVSKTTYASLWDVIGTTFGVATDPNNFKLPDLRGRVIVGNGTGSGLSDRNIGQLGGAETHTLTENEIPSHTHQYGDTYRTGTQDTDNAFSTETAADNTSTTQTKTTDATGGGQPHNNMPPFAVLNYIIKYRV